MAGNKAKARIRSGDEVIVVAGREKGAVGRVLRVKAGEHRVVVEGVRRVRRHQKPVGDRPGGILEKEMPIDISNVALWNSEEERRVKVGYRFLEDGRKVRIDRKTGQPLDEA